MRYPTFENVRPLLYASREKLDGVPDFVIERWAVRDWRWKARTSSCWTGPYETLNDAKSAIQLAYRMDLMAPALQKKGAGDEIR